MMTPMFYTDSLTLSLHDALPFSAADDTLSDIVVSEALLQALVIAPRDISPQAPADLEAIRAARERTAQFREEMAERAGGMFDRAHVAAMLGVTPAAKIGRASCRERVCQYV